MAQAERWKRLLQLLRPEVPLADMRLYVQPPASCADDIVREFLANPTAFPKFLLVGARGGGKSTELRAIGQKLEGKALCAEVDLDRSGVNAATVTAYDLLYVSALALLRCMPDQEASPLFNDLALRYAGNEKDKKELGTFSAALSGLAGFTESASKIAAGVGLLTDASPALKVASATMTMAGTGLRLLPSRGVVAETSPQGRSLQSACADIAHAVRAKNGDRPLCLLMDGLEKINGEAIEQFRQIFEQTRLLADTKWAAVIAAPPCTLTETYSVDGRGYATRPVWGFGPDGLPGLEIALRRRFEEGDLDPASAIVEDGLKRIAQQSGGLPRYAMLLAYYAVLEALTAESSALGLDHIDIAERKVAESLGRGLNEEHLRILAKVAASERLPGDERAATLFADGRILAYPPHMGSSMPRFAVHPLLRPDVEAYQKEADGGR